MGYRPYPARPHSVKWVRTFGKGLFLNACGWHVFLRPSALLNPLAKLCFCPGREFKPVWLPCSPPSSASIDRSPSGALKALSEPSPASRGKRWLYLVCRLPVLQSSLFPGRVHPKKGGLADHVKSLLPTSLFPTNLTCFLKLGNVQRSGQELYVVSWSERTPGQLKAAPFGLRKHYLCRFWPSFCGCAEIAFSIRKTKKRCAIRYDNIILCLF